MLPFILVILFELTVLQGNYSPWGVMDWIHGTSAGGDIREDAEEEWDKHQQGKTNRRSQRSKGKA